MKLSNKNHKGSALFTVVSVMMILMILVMGTFILVSAAHQKAMTNYYNNQSYVTAKSVIDTFITKISDSTSPLPLDVDAMRKKLIGVYSDPASGGDGKMHGGMNYDGRDLAEGPNVGSAIKDIDPNNNYYYLDVDVTLPTSVNGLGKIVNPSNPTNPSSIRIHRLDAITFKVSATVETGDANSPSKRTVSEKIILSPITTTNKFDSSLIARSGTTMLMNTSQLYGGYVNTGARSPVFNGSNTRYIGNFYSTAKINDSNSATFFLSSIKKEVMGSDVYVANYIQSPGGILLQNHPGIIVKSFLPSGETPIDFSNPYIFASGSSNIILSGSSSSFVHYIGDSSRSVDIYACGNVDLANVKMYGNIYCLGNVKLGAATEINGNVYYGGTLTGASNIKGGTWSSAVSSITFPTPYAEQTYSSVSTFLNEDYNRDGSAHPVTIGDCFNNGAAASAALDPMVGGVRTLPSVINSSTFTISNNYTDRSGDTVTAYSGNISSNLSGKSITIEVGIDEDFFINYNGGLDFTNTTIIMQPAAGANERTMGNVYIKVNDGYTVFRNTKLGIPKTDYVTNSTDVHKFGTKDTPSNLESPSHLYLLLDGTSIIDVYESTNIFKSYIYSADRTYIINTSTAFSGDTFYDNIQLQTGGGFGIIDDVQPIIVGSCIADNIQTGNSVASIYIKPDPSIFDIDDDDNLGKYKWTPSLLNNK